MKKLIFVLLPILALVGVVLFHEPPVGGVLAGHKVTICHATRSESNPYNKLWVDKNAGIHSGHGTHNNDIIPPFYYFYSQEEPNALYSGLNWDEEGQEIWDNNCEIPDDGDEEETTPTPTSTPEPTLVPTETPRPTEVPPTPTPTDIPQEECDEGQELIEDECILIPTETPIPLITPTPISTEIPFPQPQGETREGSLAPSCSEPAPSVQPWNFLVVRNGDSADLRWIPGDSSVVDVFYKVVDATDWQFSWTGANTGHAVIDHLNPQLGYTFTLRGRNPCSDGKFISPVVVDGPQSQIFTTTYWLVW